MIICFRLEDFSKLFKGPKIAFNGFWETLLFSYLKTCNSLGERGEYPLHEDLQNEIQANTKHIFFYTEFFYKNLCVSSTSGVIDKRQWLCNAIWHYMFPLFSSVTLTIYIQERKSQTKKTFLFSKQIEWMTAKTPPITKIVCKQTKAWHSNCFKTNTNSVLPCDAADKTKHKTK